jgi:ribosomal protein L22
MKGYSHEIPDNCATARIEGVNASYKDLAEVCGRIKNKKSAWALEFLEKASKGDVPVLFRKRNKRLGHRKELRGRKGRYPKKAAGVVLKVLRSAISNGKVKGLGDEYKVLIACANKKDVYPRLASKGRWARSFLETARVEIILQGSEVPQGVEVTPPKKPEAKKAAEEKKPEAKKEEKKPEAKKEEPKEAPEKKAEPKKEEKKPEAKEEKKAEPKKEEKPAAKEEPKKDKAAEVKTEQPDLLKRQMEKGVHKDELKQKEHEKKEMPHQHGEHDKR